MLDLQSSAWANLKHAYGSAVDIPHLLSILDPSADYSEARTEPFFSLWSSLCHQGDTCTAAYAAVPHVINAASSAPENIHFSFLLLPVSIEIARLQGRGPEIPESLESSYLAAIRSMGAIIAKRTPQNMDETFALVAGAAIAIAAGFVTQSEAILELDGQYA